MQREKVLIYLLNHKSLYQNIWSTLFCCSGGFLPENRTDPVSHIPWEQEQLTKPGKQFLLQTLWAKTEIVGGTEVGSDWNHLYFWHFSWMKKHLLHGTQAPQWLRQIPSLFPLMGSPSRKGKSHSITSDLHKQHFIIHQQCRELPCYCWKNPLQKKKNQPNLWTTKLGDFKCQLKKWEGGKNTSGKACGAQESPGSSILSAMGYLQCSLGRDVARNTSRTSKLCTLTVSGCLLCRSVFLCQRKNT